MRTHHRTRFADRNRYFAWSGGWLPLGLLLLGAGLATVAGADRALRFNGASQYVELPLGETVLMDNQGPRFVATPAGSWTEANAAAEHNGSSLQSSAETAAATWTPFLPRAGRYDVYAYWSRPTNNGANVLVDAAAQYMVKHAGGLFTQVVNQNTNAGKWLWLGAFDFNADRAEFVTLRRGDTNGGPTMADAVRFVNHEAFNLSQGMTVEAWVNISAFDTKFQAIITKGNAWGLTRFNDTDKITFRTHDGVSPHDLVSAEGLASNRWYHVAAVYDGATKFLFIDGELSASESFAGPVASNIHPVLLGGNGENPGGDYFKGELENVRLWSVARRQNELLTYSTNHVRGSEPGLLGDWRFDEESGLSAGDSSVSAMHGLLRKSAAPPVRVAGLALGHPLPGPQALRFNGYGQYVALPPGARFDFTNHLTLEAWVYFDFAPDGLASLLSKGADAWELALAANGKLVFRTAGLMGDDPDGSTNRVPAPELVSNGRLDAGVWYHVAAVWNGFTGTKSIYINGELDNSAGNLDGQVAVNPLPVLFAARPSASGQEQFFGGVLDEVRIWSLVRDDDQILENIARDLNRTEPGLVGFWNFDEGNGLVAEDVGPDTLPADGALLGDMSNLNRVEGRRLGSPFPLQYSLNFDGVEEYIQIAHTSPYHLTNLTIEAWVKPTGTGFRNILMKGDHGYGLAIDEDNYLRYFIDTTLHNSLKSDRPLELERDDNGSPILDGDGRPVVAWNHVAVVVNRAANQTTFYINGKPAGTRASSIVRNNSGPIILGKQGSIATGNYFQGLMDEVRLWNLPRPSLEIELLAFNQLPSPRPAGLIGYWTFNEGSGSSLRDLSGAGNNGTLVNMDLSNWSGGTDWGVPALPEGMNLALNPDYKGLWIGQVLLSQVNEIQAATQGTSETLTDTADTMAMRILLHVGANGQVRLLKDVIIMQKGSNATLVAGNPLPPVSLDGLTNALVLVTRPDLIPNFQGVAKRGGKLVGLRYGTVAFDFTGFELPLLGGVGAGNACMGRIELPKNHPTNPYRHKYHPDHRSGFDIARHFSIEFDGAPGDPLGAAPGYGVDRLTGKYHETVTGLHKIPLKAGGTITLNRISTVSVLNDGQ